MNKTFEVFFAGIAVLLIVWVSCIIGAAFGALSGYFVAFIFPATCAKIVAFTGFKIYQLGAICGFVGAFFRSSVTNNNAS